MRIRPVSRRDFIRQAFFGACGAALIPASMAAADERVPERVLGKTREFVSLLSIHVPSMSDGKDDGEVVELIHKAVNTLRKPVISLAGEGQAGALKLAGKALRGEYRKNAFVTAATTATDKQGALAELGRTLDALQMESLDLWMLDESIYRNGSKPIFSREGVITAAIEAKQRGLARHIGFRGYRDTHFFETMYGSYFDFDAVEIPIDGVDPYYAQFQKTILPRLLVRNYGIIAVNPAPARSGAKSDMVFPLLWSQLFTTIAVGFESAETFQQLAGIARGFKTVPREKRDGLLNEIAAKAGARS